MGLREAKKSRTRAEILEVARALFLKQGFDGTRVAEIARRLQISEQTVFNYFPSKQAIVEGLAQEWVAANARAAVGVARPLPRGGSVLAFARQNLADNLRRIARDRSLLRLLLDHSSIATLRPLGDGHQREGQDPQVDLTRAQVRGMAEMYTAAQRAGELRPDVNTAEVAELMFHIIGWSLRTWVDTEPEPPLVELVFRRARLLMGGVLAAPPSPLEDMLEQVGAAPAGGSRRG
jgi:AcrR family transcriptional regulator